MESAASHFKNNITVLRSECVAWEPNFTFVLIWGSMSCMWGRIDPWLQAWLSTESRSFTVSPWGMISPSGCSIVGWPATDCLCSFSLRFLSAAFSVRQPEIHSVWLSLLSSRLVSSLGERQDFHDCYLNSVDTSWIDLFILIAERFLTLTCS